MTRGGSVEIIENFWARVWQSRNSHAVDKLIAEDFTITSGGVDIPSHAEFKKWVSAFLSSINDFRFEVIETFQNEDGSRIASRWRVAGKNNGFMGSEPCQTPFTWSTAVWEVREDGLLQHNWVERNAFEVNRYLWEQQTDSCRSSVQPTGPDQAGFGFAIVGSCPRSSPTSSARAQAAARIAAWSNAVIEPGDRRLQDRYGHLLSDFDRSH